MRLFISSKKHCLLILFTIALCMNFTDLSYSQGKMPLTLSQIEKLIQIKTSDSIIATEIRNRGVDFIPNRAILERLRQIGAGPQTISALREIMPMLDEAKQKIPDILKSIYKSLNEGNPRQVSHLLSSDLINNSESLDRICKPFTYRDHYIENIIERPGHEFDTRVRVLFKPVEENAYTLVFGLMDDFFYLKGFRKSDVDEWFRPWKTEGQEMSRKFIFAAKAKKYEIISQLITPYLSTSSLYSHIAKEFNIESHGKVEIVDYKGLKAKVEIETKEGLAESGYWTFLVDIIKGEHKIVKWSVKRHFSRIGSAEAEDPNIENYTLWRFKLKEPVDTKKLQSYLDQGNDYAKKGEHDKAIEEYNKAIAIDSNFAKAYAKRGLAYYNKDQNDRAIEDFNKAISIDPNYLEAYHNRGSLYYRKGQYDMAIEDYNKAIAIDQNDAFAYINRGYAYERKGQYDSAIKDYNKTIALNPNDALAYNNRGVVYARKGNMDRAISDFRKACDLGIESGCKNLQKALKDRRR